MESGRTGRTEAHLGASGTVVSSVRRAHCEDRRPALIKLGWACSLLPQRRTWARHSHRSVSPSLPRLTSLTASALPPLPCCGINQSLKSIEFLFFHILTALFFASPGPVVAYTIISNHAQVPAFSAATLLIIDTIRDPGSSAVRRFEVLAPFFLALSVF